MRRKGEEERAMAFFPVRCVIQWWVVRLSIGGMVLGGWCWRRRSIEPQSAVVARRSLHTPHGPVMTEVLAHCCTGAPDCGPRKGKKGGEMGRRTMRFDGPCTACIGE